MTPSSQIQARRLQRPVNPLALMERFPNQWSFFLDSGGGGRSASSRWSLLLRQSGQVLSKLAGSKGAFFDELKNWLAEIPKTTSQMELPFLGGVFVYLGYEMAQEVEPVLHLPRAPDPLPMAFAARCPVAIAYDHWNNQHWLIAECDHQLKMATEELDAVAGMDRDSIVLTDVPEAWQAEVDDPECFKKGVERIKQYIRSGDVFQVNLSRQWRARTEAYLNPLGIYRSLRAANPAPFSGIARLPGGTILSSSPERLVSLRGSHVSTRPIAGTRPRGLDPERDRMLLEQLRGNPKEQAEHIMLIDLERNDLGRVCQSGSVKVDELMVIESYQHVHHIVSNVIGELRAETSSVDLIKAVFPGGTITGCPKVRCMEIIAELEEVGRSFYTGAMGYISADQTMDLNILIRSILVEDKSLSFRAGAGIVADSDPDSELLETEFKARGLLRALGWGTEDD